MGKDISRLAASIRKATRRVNEIVVFAEIQPKYSLTGKNGHPILQDVKRKNHSVKEVVCHCRRN